MNDISKFLSDKIKEYYTNNTVQIKDIEKREFGYGVYGKKIYGRHLEFRNNTEFNEFLKSSAPHYVSYSSAYYKDPKGRPMENKGILGGDLVFEFDADDIHTRCKDIHDYYSCKDCLKEFNSKTDICDSCGSKNIKHHQFFCDLCIEQTKIQVIKLYELLESDFGINRENMHIMYSGHKGFHLKIISDNIYNLTQKQRLEIMNYISQESLNFSALGFVPDGRGSIKYVGSKFGRGKKYLTYLKYVFENYKKEDFEKEFNFTPKLIEKIQNNSKDIIDSFQESFYKLSKNSESFWYNTLNILKDKQKLLIDKQTTVDIHKIIRAENTIHGGSMLVSLMLDYNDLKNFNPWRDACSFSEGELKIHLNKVPKLLLSNQEYGPFNQEIVSLPINIALYFLAIGVANEVIL